MKKQICLLYSQESVKEVKQVFELINSSNILVKNDTRVSDVLIFFNNSQLKNNYESVQREKKIIFFILLENTSSKEFVDLNVFNFTQSIDLNLKKIENKRFQTFLYRSLEFCSNFYNFDFIFHISTIRSNCTFNNSIERFEMISEDEVLVKYYVNFIMIYNLKFCEWTAQISPGTNTSFIYCWIPFLSQIVCVNKRTKTLKLFDKNSFLCCELELDDIIKLKTKGIIRSILCNKDKEEIYIHVFEYSLGETIWILDKRFKIIRTVDNFSMYDLASNFSNVISFRNSIYSVFRCNSQCVIFEDILKKDIREILIVDLTSYSIIKSIKTPYRVKSILNDKLILSDDKNEYFFICEIVLQKNWFSVINNIESKYICKLNKHLMLPHLYSNPYLLPCGNSACLGCIHLNYNLYKKTVKCNFENCVEEHKLTQQLERDCNLISTINQNCKELSKCLLEKMEILLAEKGKS